MRLRVAQNSAIADGIHRLELRHADGGELPAFTAGAHIGVRVPSGEMRKYSLCNAPDQRERYLIGVKVEHDGRGGSSALVASAEPGTLLECTPPQNDFPLDERAKAYLFIAGGIGITPILSMVQHLQAGDGPRFKLYYCTRNAEATAFREELSAPQYRGKVIFHHDEGHPDRALDLWPILERPLPGTHVYCCGPRPMLEAVRDMTGHWSSASIHFESFIDAA